MKINEIALRILISEVQEHFGDDNYQIFFDGEWGLVEDGNFLTIGTFRQLEKYIAKLLSK